MTKKELLKICEESIDASLAACDGRDPLEAWTCFMDRLGLIGQRKIKKRSEKPCGNESKPG